MIFIPTCSKVCLLKYERLDLYLLSLLHGIDPLAGSSLQLFTHLVGKIELENVEDIILSDFNCNVYTGFVF